MTTATEKNYTYRPLTYRWQITLEHDNGKITLEHYAANALELIERITDIERAPIRAVIKLERLDG